MKKRTIDRKNKEGLMSSVAKNLGLKSGSSGSGSTAGGAGLTGNNGHSAANGNGDTKGEFDDLISALRTGDVFGEDMAKFKRSRKTRIGAVVARDSTNTSPPRGVHREDSRERTVVAMVSGRRQ